MDEKAAWNAFCMTGKVEDYIRYSRIKNGEGCQTPTLKNQADDIQYRRNYHKGADRRGK